MNRRAVIWGCCVALGATRLMFAVVPEAGGAAAQTLGERIAHVANNPDISGLLLGIGFAGLLVEMQTLGLVAGVVGIAALAFFFSTHLATAPDTLVLGLAALGLIGILLELHVLPGHGVSGVLGIAALVSADAVTFGPAPFVVVVQALSIAIVVTIVLYALAARVFPRNAFAARLIFRGVQGPDYVAAPDYRALLGRRGTAASFLRPAGHARIDGQRIDVLTDGEFVPAGRAVVVTRVEGARIFVRPEESP